MLNRLYRLLHRSALAENVVLVWQTLKLSLAPSKAFPASALAAAAVCAVLTTPVVLQGNMPNVNILSLSNNMLSGTLPAQWGLAGSSGGMSQLNSFFLAGNRLQGMLPAWDQNGLQQMNQLDISHNALTGCAQTPGHSCSRQHSREGISLGRAVSSGC